MSKNIELPSEVAKKCFLFETINYLVCGCPPVESFDHDGYDFRSCEYLYIFRVTQARYFR